MFIITVLSHLFLIMWTLLGPHRSELVYAGASSGICIGFGIIFATDSPLPWLVVSMLRKLTQLWPWVMYCTCIWLTAGWYRSCTRIFHWVFVLLLQRICRCLSSSYQCLGSMHIVCSEIVVFVTDWTTAACVTSLDRKWCFCLSFWRCKIVWTRFRNELLENRHAIFVESCKAE